MSRTEFDELKQTFCSTPTFELKMRSNVLNLIPKWIPINMILSWSFSVGKLSRCPYRDATEFYVPQIGYQLHRLLNVLKVDLRSLNCVGHSLGAHIVSIIILYCVFMKW